MTYKEYKNEITRRRHDCRYCNAAAFNLILNTMILSRLTDDEAERLQAWRKVYALPLYNKNGGAYCETLEILHSAADKAAERIKEGWAA